MIVRTHVPAGSRKPRPEAMLAPLPVRLAHLSRDGLSVSAWHVTPTGRARSAILVDGRGRHYAPVGLRVGHAVGLEELAATLGDTATRHRLGVPGIEPSPSLPLASDVRSRSVEDDGLVPAARLAAELSDALVLVGGVVHRRVGPPCVAIQFPSFESTWPYRVSAPLRIGVPERTAWLRLPPGTDTGPYEAAIARTGREPSKPDPRRVEAGAAAPAFGHAELVEDLAGALPWTLGLQDLVLRPPSEIRAMRDFQEDLGRAPERDPAAEAGRLLAALSGLAARTSTPLGASMLALYGARMEALA